MPIVEACIGICRGTQTVRKAVPTPTPGFHIDAPGGSALLNGEIIFGNHELYKSDGTEAGTVLLKDINLTPGSSNPTVLSVFDDVLYFFAKDGTGASAFWRSDGTTDGTTEVKRLLSGVRLAPTLNGKLLFVADDGVHGAELWRSDGTPGGTVLVKDISPGADSGLDCNCRDQITREFVRIGDTVFSPAQDGFPWVEGTHGIELWRSDGTESGTMLVADINPGSNGSEPMELTAVNGALFFMARDNSNLQHLWKTDGTASGTVRVISPAPGPDGYALTDVNGTLFFVAAGENYTLSLWKSDGTPAGTLRVKGNFSSLGSLVNLNGTLLFAATIGTGDLVLWRSDGTEAGTRPVKKIPGRSLYLGGPLAELIIGDTLFFSSWPDDGGIELWKSDGTAAGTSLVKHLDLNSNLPWVRQGFTAVAGRLIFDADNGEQGRQVVGKRRHGGRDVPGPGSQRAERHVSV